MDTSIAEEWDSAKGKQAIMGDNMEINCSIQRPFHKKTDRACILKPFTAIVQSSNTTMFSFFCLPEVGYEGNSTCSISLFVDGCFRRGTAFWSQKYRNYRTLDGKIQDTFLKNTGD